MLSRERVQKRQSQLCDWCNEKAEIELTLSHLGYVLCCRRCEFLSFRLNSQVHSSRGKYDPN